MRDLTRRYKVNARGRIRAGIMKNIDLSSLCVFPCPPELEVSFKRTGGNLTKFFRPVQMIGPSDLYRMRRVAYIVQPRRVN